MSILEAVALGMAFGGVIGGVNVQWANDRAELNRLKSPRTRAKKPSHVVKHKQLEYKGEK